LARDPIFNVVTYQGYGINEYTFYTERQDKKNTCQNSGVRVDAYDVMGEDKIMYYGQIKEICELDFHGFKISLFCCNLVDANKGVIKDKYGFITVDLNCDRTTSKMRGLSPKIISGDSRRSENAQTHTQLSIQYQI
jgi:hypothetical protein